jgi:thiamine-monophosphate kinase
VTVGSVTERDLIARVRGQLAPPPDWLLVGIGDDAAVVEPERNRVEVLTVDAVIEGIHFDRAFVLPEAIGHRALAVNLSDLAAMGAAPRLALLSMALPPALPLADFDAIVAGFAALAARHALHVVGGNLTRSPGPLMIDVTLMGTVKRRQALTRSGARPGDDLYVSGSIGSAAAGLALLRERGTANDPRRTANDERRTTNDEPRTTNDERRTLNDERRTSNDERLTSSFLYPTPRLALGIHLARNRAASACMDLSDGLADGFRQMAEASAVGMTIDAGALPVDPAARAFFESRGQDPILEALTAGDDYELLIAVRPRSQRRLTAAMQRGDVVLTRIGRCTAERGITLRGAGSATIDAGALPQGFQHFARPKGSHSGA